MKRTLNDQIKARMITLLDRWEDQSAIVKDDMLQYIGGFNISKLQISKDVSKMKETFRTIESIIKELK